MTKHQHYRGVWLLTIQTGGCDSQSCHPTDRPLSMPVGAVSVMLAEVEDLSTVGGIIPCTRDQESQKMETGAEH